jgi:hypothetical protein
VLISLVTSLQQMRVIIEFKSSLTRDYFLLSGVFLAPERDSLTILEVLQLTPTATYMYLTDLITVFKSLQTRASLSKNGDQRE